MDVADESARAVRVRPAVVLGAAPALEVFELSDLLKLILRLTASANALLVTKRVARDAPAVALAMRKLIWQDRILKGTAILKGHTNSVESAAFSPDGKRVVTASEDGTARLWDAETGALQRTIDGRDGPIRSCAFSPDGERIVTASGITARLWNAETGAVQTTLEGHTGPITSCVFSPNGERVATTSEDGTAQLWDAETSEPQMSLEGHDYYVVTSCAFSPDGTRLVTASEDKTAQLWDAETGGLLTLEGHIDWISSCAFSPNGECILTASEDGTAMLWDAETGALLLTLEGTTMLLDADALQRTLEGHTDSVNSCTFLPDGKRLVTASGDETVRLWDAETGALLTTLEGHTGSLWSCACSPDGTRLVTTSGDGTARLWNVAAL